MKSRSVFVYTAIILAIFFWSLSYIWIKQVYRFIHPLSMVFWRLVGATLLLWPIAKLAGQWQKIQPGDGKYILLMTLFHPLMYFTFESYGMKYVSPTIAGVMIATIPMFIPVAAYYFFQEKLTRLNLVGLGISFMGVLLVILKRDFTFSASPLGILLLFLAVLAGVGFTMFIRRLTEHYNAITLVGYQNALGVLWFLPLFLIFDLEHFSTVTITWDLVLPMLLLVVFSSILAFTFYTAAVKALGASKAGLFGNLTPAFTALFSWIILHESITTQKIAGIIVVILGLSLSQVKRVRSK